jgi:hypothetical protein
MRIWRDAKIIAWISLFSAVPVAFIGLHFINFYGGPGWEILFLVSGFLLLPAFEVRRTWVAILLLEPIWLFLLIFGVRLLFAVVVHYVRGSESISK